MKTLLIILSMLLFTTFAFRTRVTTSEERFQLYNKTRIQQVDNSTAAVDNTTVDNSTVDNSTVDNSTVPVDNSTIIDDNSTATVDNSTATVTVDCDALESADEGCWNSAFSGRRLQTSDWWATWAAIEDSYESCMVSTFGGTIDEIYTDIEYCEEEAE